MEADPWLGQLLICRGEVLVCRGSSSGRLVLLKFFDQSMGRLQYVLRRVRFVILVLRWQLQLLQLLIYLLRQQFRVLKRFRFLDQGARRVVLVRSTLRLFG